MNHVLNGIMGLCVADALGVPVEFADRETLRKNPVVGMRAHGTYNQPAGTWSDDTSMTLCLMDSLIKGLDYNDIMSNFIKWKNEGKYTPYGEAFDIGITTGESLRRFEEGTPPLECGGKNERDNGNGSLMRILPALFYLQSIYGIKFGDAYGAAEEAYGIIHNISALTHAHKRSKIACGIYVSVASMLPGGEDLKAAVRTGIYKATRYYREQSYFVDELEHFSRLEKRDFAQLPVKEIRSSGYVVDTLEAAIWCLLNTDNYKDCVLKAVNLGKDTDTVAAVAGGLAGLEYGYEGIPQDWIDKIAGREYIEDLCNQFNLSLVRKGAEKLLQFIPYFETATEENVCRWEKERKPGENHRTLPYPVYDRTLKDFIREFYETNLISPNYSDILDNRNLKDMNGINDAIAKADIELLRAILTKYIIRERFCDGVWAIAVKNGIFLGILNRFQELLR